MASIISRRPRIKTSRPKPTRTCRVSPDTGVEGTRRILSMFIGSASAIYWLTRIPADYGVAYHLEKWDRTEDSEDGSYDCHLDPDTCECKAWLRWGHCRHLESLNALRAAGQLV